MLAVARITEAFVADGSQKTFGTWELLGDREVRVAQQELQHTIRKAPLVRRSQWIFAELEEVP